MGRRQYVCAWMLLVILALGSATAASAQNTASLSGTVVDPQGMAVRGTKVTLTSTTTGAERNTTVDDNGHYSFISLAPGTYKLTVDGGASFGFLTNESISVSVGQDATFDPHLQLRSVVQTVTVTSEVANIETSKTEVSQTIEQRRIDGLPINGRNYINFTLTNSQTTRDVSPTIGPAPNSGLNVSGARARSNMVSVDGADAVDNSVNGIRSTVSQEAVQEFQLILSNYNAEYGRATGGVINIVTKSGGNDFHGDAFGYFRNKSFQSRNSFSGEVNPASGVLEPVKQPYTRVQAGMTLGGGLNNNKKFFFGSYEYTQREETGFSSIGINNFGLSPFNCGTGCPLNGLLLTSDQSAATLALLGQGQTTLAGKYAGLLGSASSVALVKIDPGVVAPGLTGGFLNPGPGSQFSIPVKCQAGQPENNGATCSAGGVYVAPLPASYVGLSSLRGNYPVMEKTSLWSLRLDQNWNNNNHSFLRVGVSPSLVTGLSSTSQNQVFGQNSVSRAGYNQSRDLNVTFQHDTITSPSSINTFRFQFARRGLHFGFSQLP